MVIVTKCPGLVYRQCNTPGLKNHNSVCKISFLYFTLYETLAPTGCIHHCHCSSCLLQWI